LNVGENIAKISTVHFSDEKMFKLPHIRHSVTARRWCLIFRMLR